jgi:hypothetical protein
MNWRRINYTRYIGLFFIAFIVFIEVFFSGFWAVGFFIQIILIAFIATSIVRIWKKWTKADFLISLRDSILRILMFLGGIFFFFFSFISYHHVFPGYLSDITLSDGQRSVIFLEMSHIATSEFYIDKRSTLQSLSASGYTILMEWVQSGSIESEAKLSQALWFELTPTLYATISDIVWLEAQDSAFLYRDIPKWQLKSVDISIDTLVGYLSGSSMEDQSVSPLDLERDMLNTTMSPREKALIAYIYRGILNLSLKNTDTMTDTISLGVSPDLMNAILDKRNQKIIEYIQSNPQKNIVVVYGGLHTNGIMASLQESSPTWKILQYSRHTPYRERR